MGKQVFTSKTYGAQLYKWSPESNQKKVVKPNSKPFYCNAIPFSQGQDWITSYVYDITITDKGEQQKIAYVACDYVE